MTALGDDGPRYPTLRDYLSVVRVRWYVIVGLTVLFGAAALGIALRERTTYQASTSVQFTDPTQGESELLGVPTTTPSVPAQLAANAQATLNQPPMLAQARHNLGLSANAHLPGSASAYIAPTTGYLVIQGQAPDAATAAKVANAFGHAEETVSSRMSRAQFKQLARVAQRELRGLTVNDQITREVYEDRYVRLTYLAQTATPATLITPATTPTAPSSPHVVTDTALGLLVGLTIGILAAFLVDALDRRLRRSGEITGELGWPILGNVREDALGGIPFAAERETAHSGLDREAFHILRRNIELINLDRQPRSIAVTSALPEEGKSTVAASLAYASALSGKLTLLVECDLRRPVLAERLALHSSPGLTDFLRGDATPAEVVQTIALPAPSSGDGSDNMNGHAKHDNRPRAAPPQALLAFIAAGKTHGHPAELLASERFHKFVQDISATYDAVVFDTAPLLPVADTLELLPEVDTTLVCLRATKTTRDEAQALRQAIARVPDRQVGLVITGAPQGAARDLGYYAYAYGYE